MNKETIKKSIATIGIAGLIMSVGFTTGGCQKKSGSCGQGAGKADTTAVADSTASCGQMQDSTGSCGQAHDSTGSCGQ